MAEHSIFFESHPSVMSCIAASSDASIANYHSFTWYRNAVARKKNANASTVEKFINVFSYEFSRYAK